MKGEGAGLEVFCFCASVGGVVRVVNHSEWCGASGVVVLACNASEVVCRVAGWAHI